MRNLLVLPVLVVLACSGDHAELPDAPLPADARPAVDVAAPPDVAPDPLAPDLACAGQPPPAGTGTGPISITGKVFAIDHYEVAPAVGAMVELRRRSDDSLVGTATAGAEGAFAIAAPSPIAGYFVVTASGHLPTRAFSDTPLAADEDAALLVVDAAELARWYGDAGTSLAAGARTVVTVVRDCAREPIDDSTVVLAPAPATLVYYDDPGKRWNPALGAATNGIALATATAASLTITPRSGVTSLPAEPVEPLPDVLTLVVISPFASEL
ncbi:MAG: hypothetical protein H6Q90_5225 [Deltaproteobacteria bacterium]|nr:hypothetical protein [Deltaproteobacteria bacterium]